MISVGNITLGGTGKTPLIDWFLDFCTDENITPAVLTRGYKAERTAELQILSQQTAVSGNSRIFGDEPWLLFNRHPQYMFYISPNRILAAQYAEKSADLLLLDDGMQHLKLNRNLNIVLIDSVAGIGNGRIFPLGPLREPLSSLSRADAVVYSKSNLASTEPIRRQIKHFLPSGIPEFESRYLPIELLPSENQAPPLSIETIKGKKCLLFSGIGNAKAFAETVSRIGGNVVDNLVLEDHQEYHQALLQKIKAFIDNHPHDFIICTEKDWVKLEPQKKQLPLFYRLIMKVEMEADFISFIKNHLDLH